MKEFTFVTYSYNHSKYLVEHLESIKYQVCEYGKDIQINYLFIDDASTDSTKEVFEDWIAENRYLFNEIKTIFKQENKGIVDSFCCALREINTVYFKSLASDDKYFTNNIFELYSEIDKKIIITPSILFGNVDSEAGHYLIRRYKLVRLLKKNTKKIMEWENIIQAPGTAWDLNGFDKEDLINKISVFKMIEDYPRWRYLLDQCGYEICVINKPYVCYRIGSGISTGGVNEKFVNEQKKMAMLLGTKAFGVGIKQKIYRGMLKILQRVADVVYINWEYPTEQ